MIRTSENLCHACGGEDPNCQACKGTGDQVRANLELLAHLISLPSVRSSE